MSANRLWGEPISLNGSEIVGHDSSSHEAMIERVGLVLAPLDGSGGAPELVYADKREKLKPGTYEIDVVAKVILANAQYRQIELWLTEYTAMNPRRPSAAPSVSNPHCFEIVNQVNGRVQRWSFSHAGFVFEAFQAVGISLACLQRLPVIDFETLQGWFSDLRDPGIAAKSGFANNVATVKVLLPGYLINSSDEETHPMVAQMGHAYYPPKLS